MATDPTHMQIRPSLTRFAAAIARVVTGALALAGSSACSGDSEKAQSANEKSTAPTIPSTTEATIPVTSTQPATTTTTAATVISSAVGTLSDKSAPLSQGKFTATCDYVRVQTFPERSVAFVATISSVDKTAGNAQIDVVAVSPSGVAKTGNLTVLAGGATSGALTTIANKTRWSTDPPVSRVVSARLGTLTEQPERFELQFETIVDGQPVTIKGRFELSNPAPGSIAIQTAEGTQAFRFPDQTANDCISL